jgi:hypothetical protein
MMKIKTLAMLVAAALLPGAPAWAAETDNPATDLSNLVAKVKVSLSAGQRSEASQTDNLKEFKYHDKGFEIIGVSLDREGDKAKLAAFIKEHHMPWSQFYDGKYWQNELAVKCGIQSIPATYLLDGSGKIIAKNVRADTLEPAVKKALGIH